MKTLKTHEIKLVDIQELFPDPAQPRQDFDEESMKKLEESILQKGIMNPIVVEPKKDGKYLIIDGERRYRAALKLKFKTAPVNILEEELTSTDRNIIRFQLQETFKSWTLFEKAEALSQLKSSLDLTIKELAQAIALSTTTIEHYLSILSFNTKIRKEITKVKMPFSYIEAMSRTKSIMPEKLEKENPDWLSNSIIKYKKGFIKTHHDFKIINRLIHKGEYKVVSRFLKDNDYTANNALADSDDERTKLEEIILSRAKKMVQDLKIIDKNSIKLNKETLVVLEELKNLI